MDDALPSSASLLAKTYFEAHVDCNVFEDLDRIIFAGDLNHSSLLYLSFRAYFSSPLLGFTSSHFFFDGVETNETLIVVIIRFCKVFGSFFKHAILFQKKKNK